MDFSSINFSYIFLSYVSTQRPQYFGAKTFSAYLYIKIRQLYIKFRHSIKLKLSGFEWHLDYQLEAKADKFLGFSYKDNSLQ